MGKEEKNCTECGKLVEFEDIFKESDVYIICRKCHKKNLPKPKKAKKVNLTFKE